MDPKLPPNHSHLFTLRLWPEDVGHGRIEWRGQVKHVLTGQTDHFRDWAALVDFLLVTVTKLTDEEDPIGIE